MIDWVVGDGAIWVAMAGGVAAFVVSAVVHWRGTKRYKFDSTPTAHERRGAKR